MRFQATSWGRAALQAHLLRIVDPATQQPLTMDRLEDEASIMFVAGPPACVCVCMRPSWASCFLMRPFRASHCGISAGLMVPCNAAETVTSMYVPVQGLEWSLRSSAWAPPPCWLSSALARAGSETTGYSIAWTLYLLAKHPAVQAKLEAELDAAGLLATPARPHPRAFTFADISRLRYLDAVLKVRAGAPAGLHGGHGRCAG